MGDRGQVKINGVFLYTHWGASDLIADVKKAIGNRWRWDDHEYLARIIFDVMICDNQCSETGYGIGTYEHGDIWRLIEVRQDKITVKDYGKIIFEGCFDEFLKWGVI